MDKFEVGGDISQSSNFRNQFDPKPTGDAVFDASQYDFFGSNVVEEVELWGLEDEDDTDPPAGFIEDEYQPEEEESSKVVGGPINAGFIGDGPSRENSSVAEWVQDGDFPNWVDQPRFDDGWQESKSCFFQPLSSSQYLDSKNLYRTSSYPEQPPYPPQQQQQLHQHYSTEPILTPKSSFTSFPPPGATSHHASHPDSQSRQSNIPYHPGGVGEIPFPSPNRTPFSIPQLQLTSQESFLSGNVSQFSKGLPLNGGLQSQLLNKVGVNRGDHSNISNNLMQQNLPHNNGLIPPQLMPQQRLHQFQPSFGHLHGLQSQLLNQHLSTSPRMMNNLDMLGLGDLRDPRIRSLVKGGRSSRVSPGLDISRNENGWPKFKSKYMTAAEIENILRMQLTATHGNDPYTDDYYHQACLAKRTNGSKPRHLFCPNTLRDGPSATRANEPHPFLQVDALGRVSFSSVRRPRPLLEVDPTNSSGTYSSVQNVFEKPLEQEPMLAARVTIEDCLCLLLDVDDIDRFLQFNQLQETGVQLRERRQVLLEGVAALLHVVDPLDKNGYSVDMAPEDDLVFLRLLSLSKGRKLLSKYLKLLSPGDELVRIICMAIHRHLRFLFGALPAENEAAGTINDLSKMVSFCVSRMDLKALAACLASVVCSPEQPPLRPMGSPSGHGASVILRSLLERATEILRDPLSSGNCSVPNRAFWQASFDAFFSLLTKYCFNKYDTVMQSFLIQSPSDISAVGSDAARAISREMPVELLRASLPHTSEQQRKVLLEFAQRSMPVQDF